jgi:putative endonuclease
MAVGGKQSFLNRLQLFGRLSDASRQYRERFVLTRTLAMGRKGEDLAHRYLRSRGFEILARRFRLPDGSGEIDIVARDHATLVFVEVKTRRSAEFSRPERAIDAGKQRRLVRAASSYLLKSGANWSHARFDLISIVMAEPPSVTHYKDAFFPGRSL